MKDIGTSTLIKGIDKEIAVIQTEIMVADSKLLVFRSEISLEVAV